MKKAFLLVSLIFSVAALCNAQISINQADMPAPGDTLRLSLTNIVPADFSKTAMDTSWNFINLGALSQRVDTFVTVTVTPPTYQLFFVTLGGANLASPLATSPIPGVAVTQGYNFLKNSATSYSDLGSAYTIQGFPLPAKYDIPDKYYQFPMSPGLTWSSISSFSLAIPNLAFYSTRRTRTSIVDGWGNLMTPYGTFQTLRVKSTLAIHDSIYIDSLSVGFPFNRDIVEYKWLARGGGIPMLQINQEGSITTAYYRDSCRMSALPLSVSLGPDTSVWMGSILNITARITGGTPPYQVFWSTLDTGSSITVTALKDQTYSVLVMDALQNISSAQKMVSIKYQPGFEENSTETLRAWPNPTFGITRFSLPHASGNVVVSVYNAMGKLINSEEKQSQNGEILLDLAELTGGLYFVFIQEGTKCWISKVQLLK